jgi:ApaG protein
MGSLHLQNGSFSSTTHGIRVVVTPIFLDGGSLPERGYYLWAYYITINNQRDEEVQLLRRYWKIIDSTGYIREIKGDGVVGEQPVLAPFTQFEYISGVPLTTPGGFMSGLYYFRTAAGTDLEVVIPPFSLDSPYESQSIH